MEDRKKYLLNSSLLYNELIKQTENDCLRRFLAFKIIINAMSYEDLIKNRTFHDLRNIRNVFLAHKQEDSFFEGFNASESITNNNISALLDFMKDNLTDTSGYLYFDELINQNKKKLLESVSKQILNKFQEEYYTGFRISNNFLCTQKGQIKELSSNNLSGVFYRYNSSKELSILSNFFITNLTLFEQFENTLLNFKIDYILHAVNMYDCIFKDLRNSHSIDGLYEVISENGIGNNGDYLDNLKNDTFHSNKYNEMRQIRNKLAGHLDLRQPLVIHLQRVKDFDIASGYEFVNKLDKAVYDLAQTDTAIQVHFETFNLKIENSNVIGVETFENRDYFDN